MARALRVAAATLALVVGLSGCKMTIEVSTALSRGGSGTFSVVFAIDKELADLARQSAPPGQDPFQQLKDLPAELNRSGWTLKQTTPDGGLRIEIERPFSSPEDLNGALAELEARTSGGGPTPAFFKGFRVTHSSGFFRNSSAISGTIDLSAEGLLGQSGISNGEALEQIISQAATDVFEFTVEARLPGRVSSSKGDPDSVDGGTVTWSPKFGRALSFSATASGYNPAGLAVIGVPILALVLAGAYLLVSRRRPVPAAPGWEVGVPAGEAPPSAAAAAPEAEERAEPGPALSTPEPIEPAPFVADSYDFPPASHAGPVQPAVEDEAPETRSEQP